MHFKRIFRWACQFTFLGALILASAVQSGAHPANLTSSQATVASDGSYRLSITFDTLAFVLNDTPARIGDAPMEELLRAPKQTLEQRLVLARDRFTHGFHVLTDKGEVAVQTIVFPKADDVYHWRDAAQRVLPVTLEVVVEGHLQTDAGTVAFRFPSLLDQVILTVERPGEEPASEPVGAGEFSSSLPIHLSPNPVFKSVVRNPIPDFSGVAVSRYLGMGFTHILPKGLDHILFVLGLVLLNPCLRPLMFQVTAFTIAHSMTLGLSLYGVFRLPPSIVEPLIAFSIAFVAIENLFTSDLKPWRPAVVFGFGLIHGLGFASALTDTGLPRHHFLTALIGFNGGVELGQLTVVFLAMAVLGWFRTATFYRRAIAIPASSAIAGVALFWTVQRIL